MGKDSVCMFNLFLNLNYDFSVAHCNFQIRGHESDNDQLFVKTLLKIIALNFFQKNLIQLNMQRKIIYLYKWLLENKDMIGFCNWVLIKY